MSLESTLYPGETVLVRKPANAIVSLQDHGLEHLDGTGWVMKKIGFGGKEAIGGLLYLTDRRLIFVSHALNRVVGRMSVLLPAITTATDRSGLITKKLRVTTHALALEFVVWGVKGLIAEIERAQHVADPRSILADARADPERLGSGLERDDVRDFLLRGGGDLLELATNPLDLANLVGLYELVKLAREIDERAATEATAAEGSRSAADGP
jgi:hypothetical protein